MVAEGLNGGFLDVRLGAADDTTCRGAHASAQAKPRSAPAVGHNHVSEKHFSLATSTTLRSASLATSLARGGAGEGAGEGAGGAETGVEMPKRWPLWPPYFV